MAEGAEGRRRGDDAAAAARAHGRRLRALGARIFPLFRPRRREAEGGQRRRAGHASRPDEPRRRDRLGDRRRAAKRHPGAGRDGSRRAHGGHGSAARSAPQCRGRRPHERHRLPERPHRRSVARHRRARHRDRRSTAGLPLRARRAQPGRARRRRESSTAPARRSFRAWSTPVSSSASRAASTARPSPRRAWPRQPAASPRSS